jgi:hypothetical protein
MTPNNNKEKCKGEAQDGKQVCGYREQCARYVRPAGDNQSYADFWKAEGDCPKYESLSGLKGRSEQTQDVVGQNGNSGSHYES